KGLELLMGKGRLPHRFRDQIMVRKQVIHAPKPQTFEGGGIQMSVHVRHGGFINGPEHDPPQTFLIGNGSRQWLPSRHQKLPEGKDRLRPPALRGRSGRKRSPRRPRRQPIQPNHTRFSRPFSPGRPHHPSGIENSGIQPRPGSLPLHGSFSEDRTFPSPTAPFTFFRDRTCRMQSRHEPLTTSLFPHPTKDPTRRPGSK